MRTRLAGIVLSGFLGLAVRAGAQNLVTNGEFASAPDLSAWTAGPMTSFAWTASDWQSAPASGSARVTNVAPCATTASSQCITLPLPLAATYELGAAVFLESDPQSAAASVLLIAHDGATCGGTSLGLPRGPIVSTQGQWTSFLTQGIALPPATRSVTVALAVTKLPFLPSCTPPLPNVSALFDHVRFGPTGTTPVALQSLSIE